MTNIVKNDWKDEGSGGYYGKFCARGRASRCVPSTETHTFSCQAREALGRIIVEYLRDVRETQRRHDFVRKRDGRQLSQVHVFTMFLDWMRITAEIEIGVNMAVSNIVIHRLVPNFGDFCAALEIAEEIVVEELAMKEGQRRFENPGVDHDNHIL